MCWSCRVAGLAMSRSFVCSERSGDGVERARRERLSLPFWQSLRRVGFKLCRLQLNPISLLET